MIVHMKNLEAQLDTWKSKINAFEAVIDEFETAFQEFQQFVLAKKGNSRWN